MREHKIRVTGRPKQEIDLNLLAEAIVVISEQRLGSGASTDPKADEEAS